MNLSVIIPCHNEEDSLKLVVTGLVAEFDKEKIDYEIIIVDDNSTDNSPIIANMLAKNHKNVLVIHRTSCHGFGLAVREGIHNSKCDVIMPVMGDASDDVKDAVKLYREMEKGYDVVYGSRFRPGTTVKDYPLIKLFINRIANYFIMLIFQIKENDVTNAFKAYRNYVIEKIKPLESTEFNITVEMPLKALVAGFNKTEIPVNWYGRGSGLSKHRLRALSKKYLSTTLKIWWKSKVKFFVFLRNLFYNRIKNVVKNN